MFGSFGTEVAGIGTFLVGLAAIVALFLKETSDRKHRSKQEKELSVQFQELKKGHKDLKDHVTANRVQTMRYVDRQIGPLKEGQDIILGMVADLESKVTKSADI